ncbi:hypothetical protein M404DRAFT_1005376 [Pisolithus tinctorius Marx 270]|uniref:Uncharacterized protein n=1 Tax=Pisolithus tinctorius Marx 270 TaxID=870435 RepID=A0A0C3NSC9_PISTI|nr:hypothetical protein M404DRAFT_1005376 [Pisolithus tinctorius Marx 270]
MCLQKISFTMVVTCFNSLNVTTISAGDMCIAIYGSYGHNARCMNAGEGRECGKRRALSNPRWEQDPVGRMSCEDGWICLAGCAAPDGSANTPGTPDWLVLRGVENKECEEREQSGVRRQEWSRNVWNERGTGGTGMREKVLLTYATNHCTTCKILWDRRLALRYLFQCLKVVLSPEFLLD